MNPRLIAIGDVHGCSEALAAIWELIGPVPSDTIVLLGDYVDRGHDSRGVIEFLLQHGQDAEVIPLLGNHEVMFLAALRSRAARRRRMEWGGQVTLDSYGEQGPLRAVPATHRKWLAQCPLYYQAGGHFFVHANYAPGVPLSEQDPQTLLNRALDEFVPGPHLSGQRAVVGHTPQLSGDVLDLGHLICLDTGCGLGRWLTAMEVLSGRVWQVDEAGRSRVGNQWRNV